MKPGAMPILAGLLVAICQPLVAEVGDPQLVVRRQTAGAPSGRTASIRVDVDLVMVPVTVTDPRGRVVTGLEQEHFQVFEGKTPQSIVSFSTVDAPVSVGLVFDVSGSMRDKIGEAREATKVFFDILDADDEAFLMTFSDRPTVRAGFTSDFADLQNRLLPDTPKGKTALIDSVYLALDRMRSARNSRRALLVISDGMDNHSRYSEWDLMNVAMEADTQIYAIGIHDRPNMRAVAERVEARRAFDLLDEMSDRTGGFHLMIREYSDLKEIIVKIAVALHSQYLIGYRPSEAAADGKWRWITVKLNAPRGLPRLNVYTRRGYYGPGDW